MLLVVLKVPTRSEQYLAAEQLVRVALGYLGVAVAAWGRGVIQENAVHDIVVVAVREVQTKAAHLLLTNLYPTEFANVKHTVTHKSKDPEIDLSSLSQEELRAFHKMLKRVTKGDESEHKAVPTLAVIDVTNANAEA